MRVRHRGLTLLIGMLIAVIARPVMTQDSASCAAQYANTAAVFETLFVPEDGQISVTDAGDCRIGDLSRFMYGGPSAPVEWRFSEGPDAARVHLRFGPLAMEDGPGANGMMLSADLATATGASGVQLAPLWVGWDAGNAIVLRGTVENIRRDTLANRQLSRGWARVARMDVELRSRDGFAAWLMDLVAPSAGRAGLAGLLDPLKVSPAAKAAIAEWAARPVGDPAPLALRFSHPEGLLIAPVFRYLLFSEVPRAGVAWHRQIPEIRVDLSPSSETDTE